MRAVSPEVEGIVTDLSTTGCFVESDFQVREDDLVKLRFDLPATATSPSGATSSSG
jgi:hypothetical protein